MKGIWTGDYFEFVFPVGALDAGSVVSFEAPFYGRQQPVFWTVEWFDGGEWKRKVSEIEAWDGTRCEASFAIRPYGCVVSYSFALEHPIHRGLLKVRLICADGSLQADTQSNRVVKRELPYNDGKIYQSPFYFYCEGSGVNGVVECRSGTGWPGVGNDPKTCRCRIRSGSGKINQRKENQ